MGYVPLDCLFRTANLSRSSLAAARELADQSKSERAILIADGRRAREPGLFRILIPKSLFAHVRAATFGPIQRSNCHPFAFERWMFMHNGQIGDYEAVRRDLESMVDPSYYNVRLGTTDSETIFLLFAGECGGAVKRNGRSCGRSHAIAWDYEPLAIDSRRNGRRIDPMPFAMPAMTERRHFISVIAIRTGRRTRGVQR